MKELEIKNKEEIEIVVQKQQKKELKLLTSINPHQGHTCFEWNMETGSINIAQFEKELIAYPSGSEVELRTTTRRKILVREKCLYTTALNKKNAIKRFKKMIDTKK